MKKKKRNFKEEIRILLILIIVAFTIKTSIAEIYVVPTGSMENTILVGDMLFGNKFIYGMRTPDWLGIPYTRIGFYIPWYRLPKFKEVENGDVVIFEFPRDPFQKYVKRCIGIPGDSISIDAGQISINNEIMDFPNEAKFSKIVEISSTDTVRVYNSTHAKIDYNLYSMFRGDNQDNLESFVVPYKGMVINFSKIEDWRPIVSLLVADKAALTFDEYGFTYIDPYEIAKTSGFLKYKVLNLFKDKRETRNLQTTNMRDYMRSEYREYANNKIINPWNGPFEDFNIILKNLYTMDHIEIINRLKINGKSLSELESYTLKHDYYFLVGDNRDNSYDSRYWGFVPDYHVLGTPIFSVLNLAKPKLRLRMVK